MADSKITALTALTAADPVNDMFPVVDVSDTSMAASGTTKKISVNNILGASGTATLASATITGAATVGTTLGVTGVSTFAAGTALLPALTTTGDVNTGIYYPAADTFAVTTGGTERLRVNSSGQVGIAITPTNAYSSSRALQIGQGGLIEGRTGDYTTFSLATNAYLSSAGDWTYSSNARANLYAQSNGAFTWASVAAGTGVATFTPAMTLDASGYLLIGTTDTGFTSGAGYKFGPGATPSNGQVGASSSNGDLTLRVYSTGAAAYRFYVGYGGTVFATNTAISAISDARLKENVKDIDVGLSAILALKPRTFDWKAGKGKDIKGDRGFIAQEFETVFPNLIDEWADPAPEGEAPYKSVRQDLIPVLVKAIQELTARVEALEA